MRYSFIVFIVFSHVASSQSKLFIHPEVGINSSGLPKSDDYAGGKEKTQPIVSPLLGVWATRNVTNNVFISFGFQYTRTGQKYSYKLEGYDILNQKSYTVDMSENMTFKKFSIPFTTGYSFRLKKIATSIFIGYKAIYYTSGMYHYKYILNKDGANQDIEKRLNPFDQLNLEISAKNINSEIVAGVGIRISDALFATLSFSQGINRIYFKEKRPPNAIWDDPSYDHYYSRGDLAFTLRYTFLSQRSLHE